MFLPPRPHAPLDGQSLSSPRRHTQNNNNNPGNNYNDNLYASSSRPKAGISYSPRTKLKYSNYNTNYNTQTSSRQSSHRRSSPRSSPRSPRRLLKPVKETKSPRLTGGLDGDSRNLNFLTEMLSVVGGLNQINTLELPLDQTALPESNPSVVSDILEKQKVSIRTAHVYSREETLLLQQTLGVLVQKTRRNVDQMNKELYLQATNTASEHRQVPQSPIRRRLLTVDSTRRNPRNNKPSPSRHLRQVSSRNNNSPRKGERPGSAASMSILDTAISVAQETRGWDLVSCEIIRQVHNDCKERGALLNVCRLRNKQNSDLLVALCKTQQSMLESFQKRQHHMRPRTKTVEKIYRKKKREQEIDVLTDKIKNHKLKLDKARSRIQRLSNELVGGDGDDFESAMADQHAQKAYENSKHQFKTLISDLSRIERESNRFKTLCQSEDAAGDAAREAMESHRTYVQNKIREQTELTATATLVQAHWRSHKARKTEVVAARLAYGQRMVQQEAERIQKMKDAAKLKVAKWSYRHYQIWDMKCKLDGILANDREKRRIEAAKHRRKHHVAKKHTWIDFLNAAKTIQKSYRQHLWNKTEYRKNWIKKIKAEAELSLLNQVSDETIAKNLRRTIALSLQEQEANFFSRLRSLRDHIEFLERKSNKAEKVAKERNAQAVLKVQEAEKQAQQKIEENSQECQNHLKLQTNELHKLAHELEATKVSHLTNARKKVNLEIQTGAGYAINAFQNQMEKLQEGLSDMLIMLDSNKNTNSRTVSRSSNKSRQEILTDPSGVVDVDIHIGTKTPDDSRRVKVNTMAQALNVTQIKRDIIKHQTLLLATMNVLQKRSISIQEIFHEQDNECKVLVLRIASLEKELHTFDPGHDGIHHHDATHRSHYLHKMRGDRDKHHHRNHHQKHHHVGHDDDKSFTFDAFDLPVVKEKNNVHPFILPVKENGKLDLDAHTATSRRRPSVVRPHKTVGLF